jgi:hypothetical protein
MSETPTTTYYYICNPDVVLREEDEDGGLLFNPDTNQVKVINTTALFIWKRCDGKRSLQSIIEDLKVEFDQVPLDQVDQHVNEYLEDLTQSGFIGTTESQPG